MTYRAPYGDLEGRERPVKGVGACIAGRYTSGVLRGHEALIPKHYTSKRGKVPRDEAGVGVVSERHSAGGARPRYLLGSGTTVSSPRSGDGPPGAACPVRLPGPGRGSR